MKIEPKEVTIRVAKITIDEAICISKILYLHLEAYDRNELTDYQRMFYAKHYRINKSLKDKNEDKLLKSSNDLMSYFINYSNIDDLIFDIEYFRTDDELSYKINDKVDEVMNKFDDKEYSNKFDEIFFKKIDDLKKDFYLYNSDKKQKLLDSEWEQRKQEILHFDGILIVQTEAEAEAFIENDTEYLKKYKKKEKKIKENVRRKYGIDNKTLMLIEELNNSNIDKILVA